MFFFFFNLSSFFHIRDELVESLLVDQHRWAFFFCLNEFSYCAFACFAQTHSLVGVLKSFGKKLSGFYYWRISDYLGSGSFREVLVELFVLFLFTGPHLLAEMADLFGDVVNSLFASDTYSGVGVEHEVDGLETHCYFKSFV